MTRGWRSGALAALGIVGLAAAVAPAAAAPPPEVGYLVGTVDEEHGREVGSITVSLDLGGNVVREATVDGVGSFSFADPIPSGQYWLSTVACDPTGSFCDDDQVVVDITTSATTSAMLTVELPYAHVGGTVVDVLSRPLDLASVLLLDEGGAEVEGADVGGGGGFWFGPVGPGSFTLHVTACTVQNLCVVATQPVLVDPGDDPIELEVPVDLDFGIVSGTVGGPGAGPSTTLNVSIDGAPGNLLVPEEDGTYVLELPTGREVRVRGSRCAAGVCWQDEGTVTVENGLTHVLDLDLRALPGGPCDDDRFADVGADHPFCTEVTWMAAIGIAEGYPDGTFGAARALDRMQLATFLYRLAAAPLGPDPACTGDAPFTDVPVDHPFCGEIAWLASTGITTGYDDGTFRPASPVNRMSAAAFLHRFSGSPDGPDPACTGDAPFADVPVDHPFCGEIAWLTATGIAGGYDDGTYRPAAPLSRQAAAALLRRQLAALGPAEGWG